MFIEPFWNISTKRNLILLSTVVVILSTIVLIQIKCKSCEEKHCIALGNLKIALISL